MILGTACLYSLHDGVGKEAVKTELIIERNILARMVTFCQTKG
jgi:hypothetical protein